MINPLEIMKNLEAYKAKAQEFKSNMANIKCTGYAMGNQIEVVATGDMVVESIKIDPQLVKEGNEEMVAVLVASAVNNAFAKVKDRIAEDARKYSQGLGL